MKNTNDTIRNQTRDLPACNAVPQPTVPLCAPFLNSSVHKFEKEVLGRTPNVTV